MNTYIFDVKSGVKIDTNRIAIIDYQNVSVIDEKIKKTIDFKINELDQRINILLEK